VKVGEVVAGRYELRAQLGEGGMGAVWWAHDRSTGTDVALKRMTFGGGARQRKAVARFQREFHTLASLQHPRILRAFDYGVDERGPYYTMELLGGADLGDVLRDRAPLPIAEACGYLRDIAAGLAALHARGLVHRDLSPRNVRVVDGRAVLFDLGVLMNAGRVVDVAGTPAYLAPEMFRSEPVDGRADLYSLGVLAYAMVTGRKPYEARSLEMLPHAWEQPLPPPSALAEIPEALEELILDLLSHEPLARPPNAAVLIDRFTDVGDLPPAEGLAMGPGFLAAAELVGREEAMVAAETALRSVAEAGFARFAFEGASGAGKTRLLDEVAVRAKLHGVVPLLVTAGEGEGGPHALLGQLVETAFAVLPDDARAASRADADQLGRLFPVVRATHPTSDAEDGAEPAEDRLRSQRATSAFFRRLAARRPIAVLVDDLHRADEASGAALLTLGSDGAHGLALGFTRRLGESFRAPELAGPFERIVERHRLEGLEVDAVAALVRSLFGEVPHLSRLARSLHRSTAGNPLLCVEALRGLLDADAIRYVEGSWILPTEVGEASAELQAITDERLGRVGPLARRLAQILAVHEGPAPLERIVALAAADGEPDAGSVFAALSELARQALVVEHVQGLGFANDTFRRSVAGALDDDARRALHRTVGEVLANEGGVAEAQVGWHLVRGGDRARGAPMLERAGRALYEAQATVDCIAPLEVALDARREAGAPVAVLADLEYLLVNAGWVSDHRAAAAHGEPAAELLGRLAGVDTMHRLGPWMGWHLAFAVASVWAGIRWLFRFGEARGPTPLRALSQYVLALAYATAVAYSGNHREKVRRLIEHMRPFRAFRGQPPYAGYLMVLSMLDVLEGRLAHAARQLGEANRLATRPWLNPLSPMERRTADAGTRSTRTTVDVNQFDPRLHEDVAAVEAIGLAYYVHCAHSIVAVHHRYRGEEKVARDLERDLEATELQLGAWSTELARLLFAHPAYALCHDVEGLKRCLDALERRVAEGMALEERVVITRAEILRERGRFGEALALVEPLLDSLAADEHLYRQYGGSTAAQAALEAGEWSRAAEHAQRVLADGADPDYRVLLPWLRCQRVLGLAEEALGDAEGGARRLEEALVIAEGREVPAMAGQLHEARARVAFAGGDHALFLHHRARAEQWLRPTENPGLIAVVERLFELDRESEVRPVDVRRRRPGATSDASISVLTPVGSDDAATVVGGRSRSASESGSVVAGVGREPSTVAEDRTVASTPGSKTTAE